MFREVESTKERVVFVERNRLFVLYLFAAGIVSAIFAWIAASSASEPTRDAVPLWGISVILGVVGCLTVLVGIIAIFIQRALIVALPDGTITVLRRAPFFSKREDVRREDAKALIYNQREHSYGQGARSSVRGYRGILQLERANAPALFIESGGPSHIVALARRLNELTGVPLRDGSA